MSMADGEELASVLAFLDALEGADAQQEREQQAEKQQQTEKARSGVSRGELARKRRRAEDKYTTNLQRRKRAELDDLREQVAVLQSRLEQLQRSTSGEAQDGAKKQSERQAWAELEETAASELTARRRAEAENRRLRTRLERQVRLREDIGLLIDKYQRQDGPVDDVKSLLATTKSCAVAKMTATVKLQQGGSGLPVITTFVPTGDGKSREGVSEVLDRLVSEIECVFAGSSRRPQACWLEVNVVGITTEIWMSTVAECSVDNAADLLWRSFRQQKTSNVLADELYTEVGGLQSYRRSIFPMKCRPWDDRDKENNSLVDVLLHIEHFCRRVYDDATGRAILVTLALIRLPSEGSDVLLREHFWKLVTPIDSAKGPRSLTQTRYRIEPGDAKTKELSPAQVSVMRVLVQLTRRNHATDQEWLLEA